MIVLKNNPIIWFICNLNYSLELPSTLKYLFLENNSTNKMENLLDTLIELKSFKYTNPLEFPSNLKKLTLKGKYNSIIKLPEHLFYLKLNGTFTHSVDFIQSPNLTHLIIADKYDHPLNNLPQTLSHLDFSDYRKFSHPLDN